MSLQLTRFEAVIKGPAPEAVGIAQRDQATAEVAGRGDAEGFAEAAARSAVVRDRDDGGDVAGVTARGAEGGSQAVPAAERDDTWRGRGQRSMSRWLTIGSNPWLRM